MLFKRLNQQKLDMVVKLHLSEAKSTKGFDGDFSVVWIRGPHVNHSKSYNFGGDGTVAMDDKFEQISGFYQNQKAQFQKKATVFKLRKGTKVLDTVALDLSKYVGNKNEPLSIAFEKGVTVTADIEIIPACRAKHAHLFDYQKLYGAS